jgi:hypothetical protein
MFKAIVVCIFALCVAAINADQIFKYCDAAQTGYTLQIQSITVNPNPPASGQDLSVKLNGVSSKPVAQGSAAKVHVDYAGVELFDGTLDLCSFGSSAFKCPMSPGVQNITIVQNIPDVAPPGGPYTGTIDLKDQSGNQVTCIQFSFEMQ